MVGSFTQLLRDRYHGQLDDDADEFIDFAVDGAERMRDMIRALLDYSRADRTDEPLQPVDLNEVISEVKRDLALALQEADAVLTWEPLPVVRANPEQMVQLLRNLISNAIRYRRPSADARVDVSASRTDDLWTLSVRDNGIGIDPEHHERIFEVFERLHTRDEYEGTGIGLAICARIVLRHGGSIWVDCQPQAGSTFFFTLSDALAQNERSGKGAA